MSTNSLYIELFITTEPNSTNYTNIYSDVAKQIWIKPRSAATKGKIQVTKKIDVPTTQWSTAYNDEIGKIYIELNQENDLTKGKIRVTKKIDVPTTQWSTPYNDEIGKIYLEFTPPIVKGDIYISKEVDNYQRISPDTGIDLTRVFFRTQKIQTQPQCPPGRHWSDQYNKCILDVLPSCPLGEHYDYIQEKCISDTPQPTEKVKILAFGDNDVTEDAEDVLTALMKEENVSLYAHVGDGPYSKKGKAWVTMMKKYIDDIKVKTFIMSRGNHDCNGSEANQTQADIEDWIVHYKDPSITDIKKIRNNTWLESRLIGNVYVINMDSEDLDVNFERDQYKWVLAELAKAKQLRTEGKIDWIIILFHRPFFTLKSSHSPETSVRFMYRKPFQDAGVDFVIHGHNHNTQLWYPMIPNESKENGEGTQLFSYAGDGKTFDFNKAHGWLIIVTGHAGHEWNEINDTGDGVKNVMHFRDSGKFGYTHLEFEGKKAHIMSKDTANKIVYEYKVVT